ncbi:aminotransferase-like domain-containing protein [Bradyrhizobium sp. USDA 4506]
MIKHNEVAMRRYAARADAKAHTIQYFSPGMIELSGGFAFPDCLPDASKEAAIAASKYRAETMQYSGGFGLDEMRDFVVGCVAQDGVSCKRENVLIVNGAKHGIDLACRVFVEPGDVVIVTSPSYMTALHILRTFQVNWLAVRQDDEGIDTAELEEKLVAIASSGKPLPKLLFDVPDFHNPTGITTSASRRKKLVELARRFNFVIIEDDPYRKVRFEGISVPPIKSYDKEGYVIGLGTVSKILAPGLRIGWVIADEDIVSRMVAQKSDGGTSPLAQRIVLEMHKNGQIAHHIQEITTTLRRHRDAMLAAFVRYLPDIKIRKPEGGYYLWAELPQNISADALAGLGATHGVRVIPGTIYFAVEPKTNYLRLCYSAVTPDQIEEGVKRLASAYSELRGGLDANTARAMAKQGKNLETY